MNRASRLPAVCVYLIPVFGWLYVFFFQRKNVLAVYHLKQSIGLFVFLIAAMVVWAVVGWIIAWIPYMASLSMGLFAIVMAAYFYGFAAWILGMVRALRNQSIPLPLFGRWADRLPL